MNIIFVVPLMIQAEHGVCLRYQFSNPFVGAHLHSLGVCCPFFPLNDICNSNRHSIQHKINYFPPIKRQLFSHLISNLKFATHLTPHCGLGFYFAFRERVCVKQKFIHLFAGFFLSDAFPLNWFFEIQILRFIWIWHSLLCSVHAEPQKIFPTGFRKELVKIIIAICRLVKCSNKRKAN